MNDQHKHMKHGIAQSMTINYCEILYIIMPHEIITDKSIITLLKNWKLHQEMMFITTIINGYLFHIFMDV